MVLPECFLQNKNPVDSAHKTSRNSAGLQVQLAYASEQTSQVLSPKQTSSKSAGLQPKLAAEAPSDSQQA